MRKKILISLVFLGVLLLVFFCFRTTREDKLIKEGNILIEKIEVFRAENKKLPNTLSEIGISEKDGFDVLYYYKRDSLHYTISFPISAEEHQFYYSDTKQWEKDFREIKMNKREYQEKNQDFLDSLTFDRCTDIAIEFTDLYLTTDLIVSYEDEKLILVNLLKKQEFKVTDYGRGNWEEGPRIISYTMSNGQCEYQVDKLYYATEHKNQYKVTERIKSK